MRVFALKSFFKMDWLASLSDPNAVCVGLLLLALTLVWAYVMLGGSRKQPDLSALYETTGQGKRGGGKIKPKGRQVSCGFDWLLVWTWRHLNCTVTAGR